jgi:putative endonuclease
MRLPRGRHWEAVAADYLEDRGLEVLRRGYRCRLGELDLVCRDGSALVVVEVRARSSSSYGTAAETIDARKRARIVRATRHFLMCAERWRNAPIRFDVVTFDAIDAAEPAVRWIKNAFDAG